MKYQLLAGMLAAVCLLTAMPVSAVTVPTNIAADAEENEGTASLSLQFTDAAPGGITEMSLVLEGNTGLGALGIWMRLPDQLTPLTDSEGAPVFTATDALAGNVQTFYDAPSRRIALVFTSELDAAPEPLLGSFRLAVAETAAAGVKYPVLCCCDSFYMGGADTCSCQLTNPFVPCEPVQRTLSDAAVTMTEQNGTYALTLSPAPAAGTCTWSSSDPEVCAVDENGVLTALSNGTATVTATCELLTYSCAVTVQIERKLEQSYFTTDTLGGKIQLAMTPAPLHPAVWASENEDILRVSEDGTAAVQSSGTTFVTAECEGTVYRFEVTAEILRTLNLTEYTFTDPDDVITLSLTPPSYQKTVFLSSDPDIVKVTQAGTVTPVSNGTAVIFADCEGDSYECKVTVAMPAALNISEYAGKTGDSFTLALLRVPEDAEIVMQSSNPAVASVDTAGNVTLLSDGEAEITAEYDGQIYVCKVTVQSYLRGDADNDGDVDAVDSMKALIAYATVYLAHEPCPLDALCARAADVDNDGAVTLRDSMAILRYYGAGIAQDVQDWDIAIHPDRRAGS